MDITTDTEGRENVVYVSPALQENGSFQEETGFFGSWYKDEISTRRFWD